MDYQNKGGFICDQTRAKIAKQYKALFVKFDPSLFLSKHLIGQENTETTDVQAVIDTLTKEGIEWTGRTSDMAENIQPRFQANIHKEFFTEQIFQNLLDKPSELLETKGSKSNLAGLNC